MIDNGPEFNSQVVDQWAYENEVQLHFTTALTTDGEWLHA